MERKNLRGKSLCGHGWPLEPPAAWEKGQEILISGCAAVLPAVHSKEARKAGEAGRGRVIEGVSGGAQAERKA